MVSIIVRGRHFPSDRRTADFTANQRSTPKSWPHTAQAVDRQTDSKSVILSMSGMKLTTVISCRKRMLFRANPRFELRSHLRVAPRRMRRFSFQGRTANRALTVRSLPDFRSRRVEFTQFHSPHLPLNWEDGTDLSRQQCHNKNVARGCGSDLRG